MLCKLSLADLPSVDAVAEVKLKRPESVSDETMEFVACLGGSDPAGRA